MNYPTEVSTYFQAGRTWSEAGLKKAQVQYLSADMFRISHQCDSMQKAQSRADRLIELEEERVKREVECAKRDHACDQREISLHEKKMELLNLKIDYWKKRKCSENK